MARRPRGFFEVHAENYMGAGGPPHRALEAIRSDYPVSLHGVCMSIGGSASLGQGASRTLSPARSNATSPRWSPSIWPGRRTRRPISTTSCLCPIRRRRSRPCAITSTGPGSHRPAVAARKSIDLCRLSRIDHERDQFHPRGRPRTGCGLLLDVNNVFVSAANHGFSRARIPVRLPALRGRRNPPRRPLGTERRRRRSSSHRQPRRAGRRRGVEAVRDRHRESRAAVDAYRMGQQYSGMARARG